MLQDFLYIYNNDMYCTALLLNKILYSRMFMHITHIYLYTNIN